MQAFFNLRFKAEGHRKRELHHHDGACNSGHGDDGGHFIAATEAEASRYEHGNAIHGGVSRGNVLLSRNIGQSCGL